ncbi:MAG: TetR/AcrR family transcriptional regulator [Lachnospiraceae bacterium]|nr:TetR/AcrR family transcriptional regulator [Lachnospiraceae bacterium]
MRDPERDAAEMAVRREKMLDTAYRLFSEHNIESVTMAEIAREAGYGNKTLHRYFNSKPALVVAVATRRWEQFRESNRKRRPSADFEGMSAAEIFGFYLDSFLLLYREHKDLLRFNQFFNIYIRAEKVGAETVRPYQGMIQALEAQFHGMYLKAQQDHTIRTDVPEIEMFSTTLHLMLAVVTRYAVGLVYQPEEGFDAEKELEYLRNAVLAGYKPISGEVL